MATLDPVRHAHSIGLAEQALRSGVWEYREWANIFKELSPAIADSTSAKQPAEAKIRRDLETRLAKTVSRVNLKVGRRYSLDLRELGYRM